MANTSILAAFERMWQHVITRLGNYMTTTDPVGTGSFSMNRKPGTTVGEHSHTEGYYNTASNFESHAEGYSTTASGYNSHSEGTSTVASGESSHAEGKGTDAIGDYSHSEGCDTTASGQASHAEGYGTTASGIYSHAEGFVTQVTNNSSTTSTFTDNAEAGYCGHVEGFGTVSYGSCSHAEGNGTTASGSSSHAEGYVTVASGSCSHAEGNRSEASGDYSHAEGTSTASGYTSHAEGGGSIASGHYSHAEGYNTTALSYQHAQGHHNNTTKATAGTSEGTGTGTAFVIGNGTSSSTSNAFRVDYSGKPYSKSTINTTGADYAEFFEWQDSNPDFEDRRGYFVTLDGDKIKIAEPNDYILGIISGRPAIVGNADEDWMGRYIFDEFGDFIYEEFEYEETVFDKETGETKIVTKIGTKYKENPDYDPTRSYIHREYRPEWDAVGMMGVLSVRDDGTCQVNGYCKVADGGIATASESGYRVIKRINENIVKVVFR